MWSEKNIEIIGTLNSAEALCLPNNIIIAFITPFSKINKNKIHPNLLNTG